MNEKDLATAGIKALTPGSRSRADEENSAVESPNFDRRYQVDHPFTNQPDWRK